MIDKETVRCIFKIADPVGVELRSRHGFGVDSADVKGPTIWKVDGYDFGFCVYSYTLCNSGQIILNRVLYPGFSNRN